MRKKCGKTKIELKNRTEHFVGSYSVDCGMNVCIIVLFEWFKNKCSNYKIEYNCLKNCNKQQWKPQQRP